VAISILIKAFGDKDINTDEECQVAAKYLLKDQVFLYGHTEGNDPLV